MSSPVADIERLVLASKVQHMCNPVSAWMMGNVNIQYSENNDAKITKRNSNGKVDGMVAWAMARKANMDKNMVLEDMPSVWFI